jgi:hypothetical protein
VGWGAEWWGGGWWCEGREGEDAAASVSWICEEPWFAGDGGGEHPGVGGWGGDLGFGGAVEWAC